MKNSELRALSVEELEKKLVVEKENLEKLIFSHAATPIENPMRIKVARRFVRERKIKLRVHGGGLLGRDRSAQDPSVQNVCRAGLPPARWL